MLKEYKVVPHCRAMFTDHTHMKWIEWQKKISVWYRCAVLMCARRVCSRMQFELNRNDLYGRMLTTAMDSLFSVFFVVFIVLSTMEIMAEEGPLYWTLYFGFWNKIIILKYFFFWHDRLHILGNLKKNYNWITRRSLYLQIIKKVNTWFISCKWILSWFLYQLRDIHHDQSSSTFVTIHT